MSVDNQLLERESLPVMAPDPCEMSGQVVTILENISDAFLALDSSWRVVYVNKEAERFINMPREVCLGKKLLEIFPEAAADSAHQQFFQALADGKAADCELFCSVLQKWVEVRASPSQYGLFIFFRDITERKRMEETVRKSENRFRLFIEAIPQIVWTTDADGVPLYFNQRWFDYTGLSVEQFQSRERIRVLHPDDVVRCQLLWKEALATGQSFAVEYRIQSGQDGSYRWFLTRAHPIRDEHGEIIEWFGTCTDIDDQKRVEENLRESERRKDDFISMASHELKTPITSMKITNQLLQRQLQKEGRTETVSYLERMDRQINRLTRLISDLLDVTRIEAGKLELEKEPFDLDAWLKGIIDDFQQGGSLTIICTGQLDQEIVADRDRLSQVMANLITNAIKYSPEATATEVRVAQQQQNVVISVCDHGIGIPSHLQTKIFERFFRVGADKKVPGLGMGLYITSEIVKLHGGRLWVESVEGEGSTFSFSLPLA